MIVKLAGVLFVLQQLRQLGKTGIYRLLAAAILMVEVHAAAGAKTHAVGRAESFRVHLKDKRSASHFAQIHRIVLQQHDLVIILTLSLLRQNAVMLDSFLGGEEFHAAVADTV